MNNSKSAPLFDIDRVKFLLLGDLCAIKTGPGINKGIIANNPGPYPVINSGRSPLGYVDTYNVEDDPIGIASRGSVGLVSWTPGKYFRGNLNYSCTIRDPELLESRFLYHFLLYADSEIQALATHQGIPALNASNLKRLRIPVPPLEVQREIVRILDQFTQLEAELEAEMEARRRQYSHYRDELLSFPVGGVRWIAMGEVGSFKRGRRFTKTDEVCTGIPSIHYGEIYTDYGISAHQAFRNLRPDLADKLRFANPGDVLFAGVGETVADVGKSVAWLGDYSVAFHDDVFAFTSSLNPGFVVHVSESSAFKHAKASRVAQGKVKRLSINGLSQIRIPVPDETTQRGVVRVLDEFDRLINDISVGLPAEIAARRKQYEYYRDRLLTFKELS